MCQLYQAYASIVSLRHFQQPPDQIVRQFFIDAVVKSSDSRVDSEFRQKFLWYFRDFREDQFHSNLERKLAAPDLRFQAAATITRGLPQCQESLAITRFMTT